MKPPLSRKHRIKQRRQAIGKNWRDVMEYERFVVSMRERCFCEWPEIIPCDGVLAGGLCDRVQFEPDILEQEHDYV